jgi:hypothetical protein
MGGGGWGVRGGLTSIFLYVSWVVRASCHDAAFSSCLPSGEAKLLLLAAHGASVDAWEREKRQGSAGKALAISNQATAPVVTTHAPF